MGVRTWLGYGVLGLSMVGCSAIEELVTGEGSCDKLQGIALPEATVHAFNMLSSETSDTGAVCTTTCEHALSVTYFPPLNTPSPTSGTLLINVQQHCIGGISGGAGSVTVVFPSTHNSTQLGAFNSKNLCGEDAPVVDRLIFTNNTSVDLAVTPTIACKVAQ